MIKEAFGDLLYHQKAGGFKRIFPCGGEINFELCQVKGKVKDKVKDLLFLSEERKRSKKKDF